MSLDRRSLLRGLVAMPAVIAVDKLMRVAPIPEDPTPFRWVSPGVTVMETDVYEIRGVPYLTLYDGDSISFAGSFPLDWAHNDGVYTPIHYRVERADGTAETWERRDGLFIKA